MTKFNFKKQFKFKNKVLGNFKLKNFGGKKDWDFDGVPNWKDCQPKNTMRQDSLHDKKFITVYHGTPKRFVPSIMKKGLIPKTSGYSCCVNPQVSLTGRVGTAFSQGSFKGGETNMTDLRQKKFFDKNIPIDWNELHEEPAVLKITMPRKQFESDEFFNDEEWIARREAEGHKKEHEGQELLDTYEVRTTKKIPPQHIRVMSPQEITKKKIQQERRVNSFKYRGKEAPINLPIKHTYGEYVVSGGERGRQSEDGVKDKRWYERPEYELPHPSENVKTFEEHEQEFIPDELEDVEQLEKEILEDDELEQDTEKEE